MLRVFHHYFWGRKLALFAAETVAISATALAGGVGVVIGMARPGTVVRAALLWPALALIALVLVGTFQLALYAFDLYDLRVALEDRRGGGRMLKAAGVAAIAVGLVMAGLRVRFPPGALLGGAMGAVAGALVVRAGIRAFIGAPSRVFIVGNGVRARALANAIFEGAEGAFEVVATVEPPRLGTASAAGPSVDEAAEREGADYVVAALDEPRGAVWAEALLRCRIRGMRVYEAAGFAERVLRRLPVAHLRTSDLAFSDELTVSAARRLLKRTFDLAMAVLVFAVAAPLMLVVAVAIKLDSRGPVFYRQDRVGLGGKEYRLWKFRSMRMDAEKDGAVWARQNDDRVTRLGRVIRKARIDELPQVFNVLAGEMSFVGPRPERKVFTDELKKAIPFYGLREAIKPGITGWAQIRYPYGASVEDARNKLEFDLYYVKNGSLFLDAAIIFHTVRHVVFGRGAR